MLIETLGGAILGFLAVALVTLLASNAVKWHLADETAHARVRELYASSSYRVGVCLLLIFIGYSNYVLFREVGLQGGGSWSLVAAMWSALSCIFAAGLISRAFLTRVLLDEAGLEIVSPFQRSRVSWEALQRVAWSRYGWSLNLVGNGTTVSVSVFLVGIRSLLDEIERRSQNVEMTEVQRAIEDLTG